MKEIPAAIVSIEDEIRRLHCGRLATGQLTAMRCNGLAFCNPLVRPALCEETQQRTNRVSPGTVIATSW